MKKINGTFLGLVYLSLAFAASASRADSSNASKSDCESIYSAIQAYSSAYVALIQTATDAKYPGIIGVIVTDSLRTAIAVTASSFAAKTCVNYYNADSFPEKKFIYAALLGSAIASSPSDGSNLDTKLSAIFTNLGADGPAPAGSCLHRTVINNNVDLAKNSLVAIADARVANSYTQTAIQLSNFIESNLQAEASFLQCKL